MAFIIYFGWNPAAPHPATAAVALLHASFWVSLITLLLAAWQSGCIKEHLHPESTTVIETSINRQRNLDAFKKWRFDLFVKSTSTVPYVISLPLLLLGICTHTWSPSRPATYVFLVSICSGVLSAAILTVAGASDSSPFQLPWLIVFRGLWKLLRWVYRCLRRPFLPPADTRPGPVAMDNSWKTTSDDAQCASRIFPSIADPAQYDTAIKHATTLPWFKDGLGMEPPYELIISTLGTCFDTDGSLHPEATDRAYYSAQAIFWIFTRALSESAELAHRFRLPTITYHPIPSNPDLDHLLAAYGVGDTSRIVSWMYRVRPTASPSYLEWASCLLLYLSSATRNMENAFSSISSYNNPRGSWSNAPLNAILDRLLASSFFLSWPVGEDLLRTQDKSYAIYYHTLQAAHP